MNLLPLILDKREGRALSKAQIEAFVAALAGPELPDYQISALLMAVFFQGMNERELSDLTRAMCHSGEVFDWSGLDRPTADKHSTGGVGDKLSLVVAPLAAAMGLAVPMLSGRSLGFTGGTLDKLEAIEGFRTRLSREEFTRQVARLGCAIIGQSDAVAPADRRLYALRDVTGTVESLPLIVSSILSKKLAAGPQALVIDVKVGRGAFMPDLDRARALGELLRATALAFGRRCSVLFSAMDTPLGRAVGNGPEVAEALDLLGGGGPPLLRDLAADLAAEMAVLAGAEPERARAVRRARGALADGSALEIFLRMTAAQGGRLQEGASDWGLSAARCEARVTAPSDGYLAPPDARAVGLCCLELGAGRMRADAPVDPTAGIRFLTEGGERLRRGDTLALVQGGDPARVAGAAEALGGLLALVETPPVRPQGLIRAILDEAGFRLWGATPAP